MQVTPCHAFPPREACGLGPSAGHAGGCLVASVPCPDGGRRWETADWCLCERLNPCGRHHAIQGRHLHVAGSESQQNFVSPDGGDALLWGDDRQEPPSASGRCDSRPGRAAVPSSKGRSTAVREPWSCQRGNSFRWRYTASHAASVLLHQPACRWGCSSFQNQMLTKGSAVYLHA